MRKTARALLRILVHATLRPRLRPTSTYRGRRAAHRRPRRSGRQGSAWSLAKIGMAAEKGFHDASDQVAIGKPFEARDENEIGTVGIEAGQRIDLEEIGFAVVAETDVDTAAVAAA